MASMGSDYSTKILEALMVVNMDFVRWWVLFG
jgi:hypothetical protein